MNRDIIANAEKPAKRENELLRSIDDIFIYHVMTNADIRYVSFDLRILK